MYLQPDRNLKATLSLLQDALEEVANQFPDLPLFLGGDFNARVGNLEPIAEHILQPTTLMPHRASTDVICNSRGRLLAEAMRDNALILLNGRTPADSPAKHIFCGTNGKSVIDLVWVNIAGAYLVEDVEIWQEYTASDHFPVRLEICIATEPSIEPSTHGQEPTFKWKGEGKDPYQNCLAWSPRVGADFDSSTVEALNEALILAITEAASAAGMAKPTGRPPTGSRHKPWFDEECRTARAEAKDHFDSYTATGFNPDEKREYAEAIKLCKALYKTKRREYDNAIINSLANVHNTKEFWQTVSKLRRSRYVANPISLQEWEDFYRRVSPPRQIDNTEFIATRFEPLQAYIGCHVSELEKLLFQRSRACFRISIHMSYYCKLKFP